MQRLVSFFHFLGAMCFGLMLSGAAAADFLGPAAMVFGPAGNELYIACSSADQILVFDPRAKQVVRRLPFPAPASGVAISGLGTLVASSAGPSSRVSIFEPGATKPVLTFSAGHTALSPVVGKDELYLCNRFNNEVWVFELPGGKELARIPVVREPVSAVLTPGGRFLLVANHLPGGRGDSNYVAASLSVLDVRARKVVKEPRLPNGSINLRQLSVSPDGRYAGVVHSVGRYQLPVTQIDRGWVNTSALTLVDLEALEVLNTVLLDDPDAGAANPWSVGWSGDGRWLCVTHAGTDELSIIEFQGLLNKLKALPAKAEKASWPQLANLTYRSAKNMPNDMSFLTGLRRRVKLGAKGPRAMAISGSRAFVAGYFSDTLDLVDLTSASVETVSLNPSHKLSKLRLGEMYFNDATICFQGWQSCASCHDDDGRIDGLNWDLLNDGIGNPKDTKSLVLSHRTPPVMSLGIRANASIAVRAGIHNSLEAELPEEIPAAMDEWLKSLEPAPSPYLVDGHLSAKSRRGEKLFASGEAGCANCHPPGLFTDLRSYDVGTANAFDKADKEFDTPALRELWRTAPYLHDGSAATVREVLTIRNPKDNHGKTSQLSPSQLDDLVEYVLSL